MRKALLIVGTALLLAAGPATAQNKSVKIGFVSTFSGPVAVIGNNMRDSFELALDHMGRKMGGLPVELIYEDDGFKPEVGSRRPQKLVQSDTSTSWPATSGRTCCWLPSSRSSITTLS